MSVQALLNTVSERGVSDLHLNPGRPPVGRLHGRLVSLTETPIDDASAKEMCRELCDDKRWSEVEEVGSTDFGLTHQQGAEHRAEGGFDGRGMVGVGRD